MTFTLTLLSANGCYITNSRNDLCVSSIQIIHLICVSNAPRMTYMVKTLKLPAVDATSFVLMVGRHIKIAFTFDHHSTSAGLQLVG